VVADTMSQPLPQAPSPPHATGCSEVNAAPNSEVLAVVEYTTSKLNYAAIAARQADCSEVAALARHLSLCVRTANVSGVELLCVHWHRTSVNPH
jgi:hypothetical protein